MYASTPIKHAKAAYNTPAGEQILKNLLVCVPD
jgi:hypothetical protein